MRKILLLSILLISILEFSNLFSAGKENNISKIAKRLLKSYPDLIISVDSNYVYFKDNTKLPLNNKFIMNNFDDSLNEASISDMFSQDYVSGRNYKIPIAVDYDPGRIVNEAFFEKIYGKNRAEVQKNLVRINWLPKTLGQKVSFTKVNGAARQLQKVSDELDKLPDKFKEYLYPLGGTVTWRKVAGTNRLSLHSLGIAIDICARKSNYWRNTKPNKNGIYTYKNSVPFEIVEIFEKHGFIWGGKWYHYDTMHFEYRPELINFRK